MNNKDIVKNMVKLNVLAARHIARHTQVKFKSYRDIERIIMSNKLLITYGDAIENLENLIVKHCNDCKYLMKEIDKLVEAIQDNEIKNYRFGIEPKIKFTKEECELDDYRITRMLYMTNGMVGVNSLVEMIPELNKEKVKEACENEQLLNTTKIGRNWVVQIHECRAYWNIPDVDEKHLYYGYEY